MPKVVFEDTALEGINHYIERYTLYFEELYSDTGLWNEDMIIESYKSEWYARYDSIIDTIELSLSNNMISYTKPETYIRWKSKILIVAWRDEDGVRVIEKIEVR